MSSTTTKSATKRCTPCCKQSFFDLKLGQQQELDLLRTFAPKPLILTFLIKFGFFAWTISFLVIDLKDYEPLPFWLAYLSNWAAIAAVAYQLAALISFVATIRHADNSPPTKPTMLMKATWALYPIAATMQLLITLLYWLLDYPGGAIVYGQIFRHGILCALVLLDGLLYSRIPLRWKQFLFPYIYCVSWVIWSVIHAYTDIGNPREQDNDPETDDDSLYSVLNWKERTGQAAFWAFMASHVMLPILFFITLGLGKLIGSRTRDHIYDEGNDSRVEEVDEEEGSGTPSVQVY